MVEPGDMNHHSTLYAARALQWMVDASFIAAANERGEKEGLVYKNIHQFDFMKSLEGGDIARYETTVVRAGRSSVTMRSGLYNDLTGELCGEGYLTYVMTEEGTANSIPSGIELDETDDEDELAWREKANSFFEK